MTGQAQNIDLPEPNGTFVVRALTNRVSDDGKGPLVWVTGKANPLVADMKIVRMYGSPPEAPEIDGDAVAVPVDNRRELRVYSVSSTKIIRHIIHPDQVRLIEERLTLEAFLEEIDAEEGIEDDDPEGSAEPTADTQPPPPDNALS